MRVKMSRTNSDDPCAVIANGEVEEYTINITAALEEEVITSAKGINIIAENKDALINIIGPNPFTDHIGIRLGKQFSQQTSITLWNTLGVAVYKQKIGIGVAGHTINTTSLPGGVYFLLVENGGRSKTVKMVK